MTKKGIQITCSGCGEITFIERDNRAHSLIDCTRTLYHNENQSESWGVVICIFDLCPRCQKIHEKMLASFYEECGKARDENDR